MTQNQSVSYVLNRAIGFEMTQDELVVLLIEHKTVFDRIAQFIFRTPKITRLSLDKLGSCVYLALRRTDDPNLIASELKEKFGDEAEPLMERLAMYLYTLERGGIVKRSV